MNTLQWSSLAAPFVTGEPEPLTGLPLDRFLMPYFPGRATRWVNAFAPPGSWLLDPFGQDPFSALELARAGYRILVTSNNPVPTFILKVLASAPTSQEWSEALRTLSNIRMPHDERLEDFINAFYQFDCPTPTCEGKAEVLSFIWAEDQPQPFKAFVRCPTCSLDSEIELTPELIGRFPSLPAYSAHRIRSLEMAANLNDPLRPVMEEVVRYYSERALTLFQIILSRVNSVELPSRQRMLIQALLLTTADQINQLWAYPLGKNRPHQLLRPPIYQEPSMWEALLRSKTHWDQPNEAVILRTWPDLPPQKGGITIFEGRLREISPLPDPKLFSAVFSSLPRRNQAYWNLCGLWSAWLWGRTAIEPLRHSLTRQRYDWTWHINALEKVTSQLKTHTQVHTPILYQIGELDPRFVLAALLSSQDAELTLRSYALDGEDITLQTVWDRQASPASEQHKESLEFVAREAARDFLENAGEPVSFLSIFTHICLSLYTQGMLKGQPQAQPNGTLSELEDQIEDVLRDSYHFVRYNPGTTIETGLFWLTKPPQTYTPLIDRIERGILDALKQSNRINNDELVNYIYAHIRGLMTPDQETISALIQSYADLNTDNGMTWGLRPNESEAERARDVKDIQDLLERMAKILKYSRLISQDSITWRDEEGLQDYAFFPITTAVIAPILLNNAGQPGLKLIVVPGSRSNLLSYKLKRDPNLESLITKDWHFVKFRHLRNLIDNPLLSRELFASQIIGDPPEHRASQLALF
ncbi:MAG: hypothetical protein WBI14_07735 [Anaerolineaceae bacterium]